MIDDGGHDNKAGHTMEEIFDFDRTIGKVLEWAEKDGQTLVIVTGDHATGGMTLLSGSIANILLSIFLRRYNRLHERALYYAKKQQK